ncbi:alkylphosphonate utilization protein [Pseudoprimorskyibacter insulae]|uniref:Allantoinase n=1 Tax=Pseudoprimorskyibacter insulae TaxID=1695997 RepID=A0A2R8AUU6_9RHOB|nr:alkylphosphonate utilization protein [Pseudoprimorskyibacter insulae]SPF79812.1 Allantoinase [Pseudoprimorskyibacter insulae]
MRDGAMQQRSVAIEAGRITRGPLPEVDLRGLHILPGIVDLHETTLLTQRLRANEPDRIEETVRQLQANAAANGVTTLWAAIGWSWEGGAKDPAWVEQILTAPALNGHADQVDLRAKIVCETHMSDYADRLLALIQRHSVKSVTFANTVAWSVKNPGMVPAGCGLPPDLLRLKASEAAQRTKSVPRFLCRMAEAFDGLGVSYGSIADPDGETRETYSMIGAKLCERPQRRSAAALARAVSDPVVLTVDQIAPHGGCEALPPQLADAVASGVAGQRGLVSALYQLAAQPRWDLPRAWGLVTTGPTEIMRMADRGTIDYGKRADLVIVNPESLQVEGTICGGRLTYLTGIAQRRFQRAIKVQHLAAE